MQYSVFPGLHWLSGGVITLSCISSDLITSDQLSVSISCDHLCSYLTLSHCIVILVGVNHMYFKSQDILCTVFALSLLVSDVGWLLSATKQPFTWSNFLFRCGKWMFLVKWLRQMTRCRKLPLSAAKSDTCVNIRIYCIVQYYNIFNELVVTLLHI